MKRKELLIWSGVIIAGGILGWLVMSSIGTKPPPLAAGPENLKGTGIGKKLSENYYYNIDKYKQVEPKLVKYRETGSITFSSISHWREWIGSHSCRYQTLCGII